MYETEKRISATASKNASLGAEKFELQNGLAQIESDAAAIAFEAAGLRGKQALYQGMFASLSNPGKSLVIGRAR